MGSKKSFSHNSSAVALDPVAPVDVDGADNIADSTGVVDVAVVRIEDVAMVDRTDTGWSYR